MNFKHQLKEIILSAAEIEYNQNTKFNKANDFNFPKPKWIETSGGGEILDTSSMVGAIYSCDIGRMITPAKLQTEIEKSIKFFESLTVWMLELSEEIVERGGNIVPISQSNQESSGASDSYNNNLGEANFYTSAIIDYYRARGLNEDEIKVLQENNEGVYMPGYTRLYLEGQQHPLFSFVLFMSNQELGNLLSVFDDLIDATTGFDQRSAMKDVWLDLLEKHVGDQMRKDEYENMTMEEINKRIFGLPGTSELLKNKLAHLTDRNIVSDKQFFAYTQEVRKKRQALTRIFNMDKYPYSFKSNDIKYFWIEQALLP